MRLGCLFRWNRSLLTALNSTASGRLHTTRCVSTGLPSKMPLKFAANISTMFTHAPLLTRYRMAQSLGFKAVECQFPYDVGVDNIRNEKETCDLEHVLINSYPGDLTKGEMGFAARPGCESEFLSSLETTIKYAKALNCKKIHIMAGITGTDHSSVIEETYLTNLMKAAELLEKEGIVGVIEPLCKAVKPGYFLSNYEQAARYVAQINHKNLRLLLDIFHLQMSSGNLTNTVTSVYPLVGHIQVSQAPRRDELNAPGEINYKYVLRLFEELGYTDWIGLEYTPSGQGGDGVSWIKEYGYCL
ncbi:putative hydroxypyruvate isomerase isoform X1 [Dermacentor andersoni]|uniref:putative hydroxypyruvate isomerase isoform X1 n=2 Tax=Dermacentor andersoni TaxID=34620 RepID=UPI002155E524|nr:putative hydroxypyruvate isomerase [Dermacentor andersoni]